MKPLVSICIPTYNGAFYIAEAFDSAINQTYPNLEIIVSDDNSTDSTLEIINSFKNKTKTPIHIYNHQSNGIGANWNNTIKKAKGKYIKFLFQDDVLLPSCIEKMVKIAELNENIGLVYCKREIIYKTKTKAINHWLHNYQNLHVKWHSLKVNGGVKKGIEYLKDRNLLAIPHNKIGEPPAVLLHKNCFEKVGYFNTQLSQTLDFEFWYRLMPFFNIAFVDETLIQFRLHKRQASQINKTKKTKDKTLLPRIYLNTIFKHLHLSQKIFILQQIFYIPQLNKQLKKIFR